MVTVRRLRCVSVTARARDATAGTHCGLYLQYGSKVPYSTYPCMQNCAAARGLVAPGYDTVSSWLRRERKRKELTVSELDLGLSAQDLSSPFHCFLRFQNAKIPMLALVAAASTAWTPAARMCAPTLTPYRSDANFDYFRVPKELSVTLPKPLGAVLEEAAPSGVKVQELQEGGSGAETGLLKKGDKFVSVCGADCAALDFDSVMAMLVDAPDEVELQVVRTSIVRKPRAAVEPSLLTVDGKDSSVQKGVILRQAVVDTGAELYKGWMAKAQQCGGAGQCSTCWVNVVEGAENLSAMTEVEQRKGKKKPEGYRMSCQAIVQGDVKVEVP